MRVSRLFLLSQLLALFAAAQVMPQPAAKPVGDKPAAHASAWFEDITEQAGIHFKHTNGMTPEHYMPETMGSGGIFFDFDGDGWIDIYLVDGGSFKDPNVQKNASGRLYRNNHDGTFTDVTARSHIKNPSFGMGACAADYDNDGHTDLYLTNYGRNILYHNNGDGTFTDVTDKAGVAVNSWSTSCAWADIDNDGLVDLLVANYVDWSVDNNKYCGDRINNVRAYCHPNVFNGLPVRLFHNNGDGTFTDITKSAGAYTTDGKGLGVVFGDFNNDGWIDFYVANDSVPNFLFQNQGNGTFKEVGMWSGTAVNSDGRPHAGMGTDMADYDNDGQLDVFVTNLNMETFTLFHNLGHGLFEDATFPSGVGQPSMPFVGFGTAFLDVDNDGFLDVVVADGDVLENASYFHDNATYAQRKLLFHNEHDGRFTEIGREAGPGFGLVKVGRGLSVGDIDNDGNLDLLVTNNGQTPDLLHNVNPHPGNGLTIKLVGTHANRDAIGARLTLKAGGVIQTREVKAGSSYLSQSDLRAHFGLGDATATDHLDVRWPGGPVESFDKIDANQIVTIVEGKGVVRREPYNTRIAQDRSKPAAPKGGH